MKYCTYLTIYKGNRLPMFYIGYSTVRNVIDKNYHGTVTSKKYSSIWKEELRENPHLFTTKILRKHSTMFDAKARETFLQSSLGVVKNPLYVNQHIQGAKFCVDTSGIHLSADHAMKISHSLKGRSRSPEAIQKTANTRRGKKNRKKFSEQSNTERSKTLKAKMTLDRKAELSLLNQGENNPFFNKTHTIDSRLKMQAVDRSYLKALRWWTNGQSVVRSAVCPGDGWRLGRK